MLLYDAVGVYCNMDATTDIKAQVLSIWAKGCMLDNCTCIILLDMTTSRLWTKKVVAYYYIFTVLTLLYNNFIAYDSICIIKFYDC